MLTKKRQIQKRLNYAVTNDNSSVQAIVIRRLTPRLQHIKDWIDKQKPYDDIWDLCCDHGRLGLHIHQTHPSTQVHLIDKIPSIINKLKIKYKTRIDPRLHIQALDAQEIRLTTNSRQLLIIAGIGGGTAKNLLQSILSNPKNQQQLRIDVILSPNAHTFELRSYLRDESFSSIKEEFINDKGHCHEHIFVCYSRGKQQDLKDKHLAHENKKVTPTGDTIWHPFDLTKQTYLEKLILHYGRINAFKSTAISLAAEREYVNLIRKLTGAS